MATAINTIFQWFKTGLKPTETQFWETFRSFRHKNDAIPVGDIEGLQNLLDDKADKGTTAGTIKIGKIIIDTAGNDDENVAEIGNTFDGWNGEYKVAGIITALPFDINDRDTYKQAIKTKAI